MQNSTDASLHDDIERAAAEAMAQVDRHIQAGELDQAAELCRAVLAMQPAHAGAQAQLGVLAWHAGRLADAAAHLSNALQAAPQDEALWLAYIEVLLDGGQHDAARETAALGRRHGLHGAALDALERRVARAARGAPSQNEIDAVTLLMRDGRLDDVEREARALVADCPRHPFGHKALGVTHHRRGELVPAIDAMQRAAALDPANAETLSNLGFMLKQAGRLSEAEAPLRRSLELRPGSADTHNNLATLLLAAGRLSEAEASARAALARAPAHGQALNTLAVSLEQQNRMGEAVTAYRALLAADPDNTDAYSNMLFALSQMEGVDAATLFDEHRRYGERAEARAAPFVRPHANARDPERRLRVGFVSGDLRTHALTSFIEPVLAPLHGRPGLHLTAYYNYVAGDAVTARLRKHFDRWRDVAGLDDDALDDLIRADGIDILVDLSGHTAYNRLPVLARRPAPLQATWIGYPGTTGLRAVDYYLTDRYILPPGQYDAQFTEKLVYLPASAAFQPEVNSAAVNPLPALTNGHLTFGSFNRISKIGREVVAAWARLLRALPTARLLIGGAPLNGGTDQLLGWFAEEGVEAARIDLHPRTGLHDYLALHHRIDVLLDTFPYSGGTTNLHALWMGVPPLTVAGDTAAGRQTTCILEHAGLPQFICRDARDFERRGLDVCADLEGLAAIRANQRSRFVLPASDTMSRIADTLEDAFRTMWRRWCAGLPAASFEVPVPAQPS